jgi:hypothetical protein
MARDDDNPNRLIGPVLRSDVVATTCFGSGGYLIAVGQWPAVAVLALAGGIFAGLSARMDEVVPIAVELRGGDPVIIERLRA